MSPLRLLNFKNGGFGEFVKGKTLSLAIEGSRRFRPPRALGLMRYEGCLIMVFVPTVSLDRAAFMRAHPMIWLYYWIACKERRGLVLFRRTCRNGSMWIPRHRSGECGIYQKQGAELDPSSPLLGQNAANVPDANAVGITFSFGARR